MEARVAKLEAIISTLSTKADVADLRTDLAKDIGDLRSDIAKGQTDNRTWMIATVISLFLGMVLVGNFLAGGLKASQPGQAAPALAPIIIQVPSSTGPAVETDRPAPTPAIRPEGQAPKR